MARIADTDTTTLYTGRDILAAENYIRCASAAEALRAVSVDMPTRVIERLAAHVGAAADNYVEIVRRARLPYSAR